MLTIGCHMSSSKGFLHMGKEASSIGANTFQFFTRNPRGSKAKAIDEKDLQKAIEAMEGFGSLVLHGAYTMNLCTADEEARTFAAEVLKDDLLRTARLPGSFYNFHPGSHVGQGTITGIAQIAKALNSAISPDFPGMVLLETMAGKGSEIGGCFAELRAIIDQVDRQEKMGVCVDLCHIWDAGYDIVRDFDGVLTEFDKIIGLSRLKAIHVNDSQNALASHKDRHARLGEGKIGKEAIYRIVHHEALKGLPMILETPNELPGYGAEISFLRGEFKIS